MAKRSPRTKRGRVDVQPTSYIYKSNRLPIKARRHYSNDVSRDIGAVRSVVSQVSKIMRTINRVGVNKPRRLNYVQRIAKDPDRFVDHKCRKEYSRVLSWRAAQGSGRKRSKRELVNNFKHFKKHDC